MAECKMLRADWGLLYNLLENTTRGPKNFSCTEDFECYISFIDAIILERQKDVLEDVPKI